MFRGRIIRNQPAYRPRPSKLDGFHCFGNGQFEAYVAKDALTYMTAQSREDMPNETIGYLIGRPYQDERGNYLIVSAAIAAPNAQRQRASVETSLADERVAADVIRSSHPTGERVGWYHSHPFGMPQYSPTDHQNQRIWCPQSYLVGMLVCVDQGRVTVHAFRGPESQRLGNAYSTAPATSRPTGADAPPKPAPVFAAPWPVNEEANSQQYRLTERKALNIVAWSAAALAILVPALLWLGTGQVCRTIGTAAKATSQDNGNEQVSEEVAALKQQMASLSAKLATVQRELNEAGKQGQRKDETPADNSNGESEAAEQSEAEPKPAANKASDSKVAPEDDADSNAAEDAANN